MKSQWRISVGYDSVYELDDDKNTVLVVLYQRKDCYRWVVQEWTPEDTSQPRIVHKSDDTYTTKRAAQRAAETWYVTQR